VIAVAALSVAPPASAAIVTNGDFETGTLSGWQIYNSTPPTGSWFAYTGTVSPLNASPVTAPPQGRYAAITDQGDPGLHILYQDITLPAGGSQNLLTLTAYYTSDGPITSRSTLDPGVTPNQQYRIDVLRAGSPITTMAGGRIVRSLLVTTTGGPTQLAPTQVSSYLPISTTARTFRVRLAEVDTEGVFNASADAVGVTSNAVALGRPTRNKRKGTAGLPVTVAGPGRLSLNGLGVAERTVDVRSGGTVRLLVKPVGKKKRRLERSGKLGVKVTVTYAPPGLNPYSRPAKLKLKKKG
jgi:hypothetical protein